MMNDDPIPSRRRRGGTAATTSSSSRSKPATPGPDGTGLGNSSSSGSSSGGLARRSKNVKTSSISKSRSDNPSMVLLSSSSSLPPSLSKAPLEEKEEDVSLWYQLVPHWENFLQKRLLEQSAIETPTTTGGSSSSSRRRRHLTTNHSGSSNRSSGLTLTRSVAAIAALTNDWALGSIATMTEWNQCLRHFVDCAMVAAAATASTTSSSSSSTGGAGAGGVMAPTPTAGATAESSMTVASILLELTMTVAVAAMTTTTTTASSSSSISSSSSLLDLIHHVNKYSAEATIEAVRIVATSALGLLSRRLSDYHHSLHANKIDTDTINNDVTTDSVNSRTMIDMVPLWDALQQAILSRLTDTAVAVRGAAVGSVFDRNISSSTVTTTTDTNHGTHHHCANVLSADPDCHQAVVWILQHDSSPTNRALAASHLPVTWQTMEYLVYRLRDTKAVVRVAAITALHQATIGATTTTNTPTNGGQPRLQPHHMAELITAGCTDRCLATKQATRRLICTVWMKQVQYNPVTLLEYLMVVPPHTLAATTLIRLLLETAADPTGWMDTTAVSSSSSNTNCIDDAASWEQHVADLQLGLSKASFFSMEPWRMHSPTTTTTTTPIVTKGTIEDVDDHSQNHTSVTPLPLPVEHLFFVRTVIEHTASSREKEALLSFLVPDIIVLCQVLEHFASQLIRILAADDDGAVDEEDKLIFLCSELLRVATMNANVGTLMEEGSRRVFTSAMKQMLINLVTPDDLVEGCCQALWQSEGPNHIETHVLWMMNELQNHTNDALRDNATLRILAILTTLLATTGGSNVVAGTTTGPVTPSATALDAYAAYIVPLMADTFSTGDSHTEPQLALVREAAVTCLGHLGLVSDAATVRDTYQPLVVSIATNESERMELRMQAVLAWMDWSVVFRNRMASSDAIESMRALVGAWMEPPQHDHSMATVCIAAEMATKLLLLYNPQSAVVATTSERATTVALPFGPEWLARLVWLFFTTANRNVDTDDAAADEVIDDDNDETRLGSPVRLQQLLSLFFPAFASGTSDWARNALIEAIAPLLTMCTTTTTHVKSKGRRKSLPIAKMLDYIVSTVHQGHVLQCEMMNSNGEKMTKSSSPSLLAAIQVATFLSERSSDLTSTVRRALCKMIGGTVVTDINDELWEHLSLLKELIEELTGNVLDDDPQCLRSLKAMSERLVDVEVEDDVSSDDDTYEDESSLTDAATGNIPVVQSIEVSTENTKSDSQKNQTSRRQNRSNILVSSN